MIRTSCNSGILPIMSFKIRPSWKSVLFAEQMIYFQPTKMELVQDWPLKRDLRNRLWMECEYQIQHCRQHFATGRQIPKFKVRIWGQMRSTYLDVAMTSAFIQIDNGPVLKFNSLFELVSTTWHVPSSFWWPNELFVGIFHVWGFQNTPLQFHHVVIHSQSECIGDLK